MKNLYTLLLFCILCTDIHAQNHVPNCSFEDHNGCPGNLGEIFYLNGWSSYTLASPDYYNYCATATIVSVPTNYAGNRLAAHGDAYIGVVDNYLNDYREYVTTSITPLMKGRRYEVSMSVSLADICYFGSDGLGVYFYDVGSSPVNTNLVLPVTPQISYSSYGPIIEHTGWQRVTQYFVPDSAYDNIVIGGFTPNSGITTGLSGGGGGGTAFSPYYLIDSVVIQPSASIVLGQIDTDVCSNTTFDIPFTLLANNFASTNVFTALLSGPTGSFSSPTVIGTLTGNTAGTITCTLPSTASGTGYRVRITGSNAIDTSVIDSINIRITQPHTLSATTTSPLCEGDTIFLNSTVSASGVSFLWEGPNFFTDLNQNTYIIPALTSQSGKYSITTVRNACTATDTVTVMVLPMPAITISSNSPVCPGTTMQLNATSNLPGSSFSWVGPNSFNSSLQNPTRFPATYADQGIYTIFVTKDGCTNQRDIPITVQITTATPVAGSNNPICEGFPLNLTALSATPGVTYNWTGPLGYTSTLQNPTQTATTSHTGDFIVKATVNGCVSLPDTVNVQVLPKPYLGNYASPNDTVCEGTVVTFVTVPMSGVVNPVFQWFKNNVPVPGATNLTLIAPYATGDTFYCRTYCQNQCGDNLTLYSNKVGMMVMPIVNDLSITLWSEPAQPLPGNPITFHATTVSGGYTPKYQWKKNGSDIFGATSAIYNANNLAPYDKITCCVITSDPCANPTTACSDAMVVNFPTSVGEVDNDDIFQLYPNPNDGYFKLKMQNVKVKSIDIVNVSGQVVYKLSIDVPQDEYTIHMPQQLPSGTYMLRFFDGEQYYRKSFSMAK